MLKYLKFTITGAHVAFYILAWLSTISNPIVYVFSNKFYRNAFQKTFRIRNGIEASNSDKYDQSVFKSIGKKLSVRSNKNKRSEMGRSAFFMSTAELNRTLSRHHLNSTRVQNNDQYQAELSENNCNPNVLTEQLSNPPILLQESKRITEDFQNYASRAFLEVPSYDEHQETQS